MSDKWLQLRTGSEEMRNQAAFMLTTYEVRELLAERDALKAALRAEVIGAVRCYQCGRGWVDDEPERHAPGCLAAPKDGA